MRQTRLISIILRYVKRGTWAGIVMSRCNTLFYMLVDLCYVLHCINVEDFFMKTVHLEQSITKVGNSSGIIIPAVTLRELGVGVSDVVELEITPKQKKPTFDIEQLMANTDFEAQRNDTELQEWDAMPTVGRKLV